MLKLFQSYSPFSVIALLLMTLIFKLFWLIHPEPAIILAHQKVWGIVLEAIQFLLGKGALAMTFFAALNIAGQALYCNRIANNAGLFQNRNYLPALSYILFTSLLPEWNYLSAALISTWLLLVALSGILQLQNAAEPRKLIFNTGFAIACAGILSLPFLPLLLLFLIAVSISRPFRIGEWVIAFLGILTPFYLLTGILFLTDRLGQLPYWLPDDIQVIRYLSTAAVKPYVSLCLLVLMLVVGLVSLNKYSEHMLTLVKKRWSIVIAGLVVSLIPLFFEGLGGLSIAFPALVFLSSIAANAFIPRKRSWPGRILFYLFLAVLIFAEWIPVS